MSRGRKLAVVASGPGELRDPDFVKKTADYIEKLENDAHALIYEVRDELQDFFFEEPYSVDQHHRNDVLVTTLRIIKKLEGNVYAIGGTAMDLRSHLDLIAKDGGK